MTYTRTSATNISPLDEVDESETIYTFCSLHFYSSVYPSTEASTIYNITLNIDLLLAYTLVTSTIEYQHTDVKEVAREVGRYNMTPRGYCNGRFPNGNICLNRTLWFCNGCYRFNKKTYYCQQVGCDCFATHHDSLVRIP